MLYKVIVSGLLLVVSIFSLASFAFALAEPERGEKLAACGEATSPVSAVECMSPPPAAETASTLSILHSISDQESDVPFLVELETLFLAAASETLRLQKFRLTISILRIVLPDLAVTVSRNKASFLQNLDELGNVIYRHLNTVVGHTIASFKAYPGFVKEGLSDSVVNDIFKSAALMFFGLMEKEDSLKTFISAQSIHNIGLFFFAYDALFRSSREASWSSERFSQAELDGIVEFKSYLVSKEYILFSFLLLFITRIDREAVPDFIDQQLSKIPTILEIVAALKDEMIAGPSHYSSCFSEAGKLADILNMHTNSFRYLC